MPIWRGSNDAARSAARLELSRLDLEIAADTLGDAFHGRLAGRRLDAEIVGDRLDTERLTVQARQARQAGDGPFELANAAGDMLGEPGDRVRSRVQPASRDPVLQEGSPAVRRQRFQADDQSVAQPARHAPPADEPTGPAPPEP